MSLVQKLTPNFADRTLFRGAQYLRDGAVKILDHSPTHVEAVVHRHARYLVSIRLEGSRLYIACTCPYFGGGKPCKHLWATILEANRKNYLAEADEHDRLELWIDDSRVRELWAEQERSNRVQGNVGWQARKVPSSRSRVNPEPKWKQQLNHLTASVSNSARFDSEMWPPDRQIIYVIDSDSSWTSGRLALEIGYRQLNKKGSWTKFKPKRIPLNAVRTMRDPTDVQILSLLSGAKEYFYYSVYSFDSLFSHCSVSPALQTLLLPLMCATGRCYLRGRNGEMSLIEWDQTAQWELALKLRGQESTETYDLEAVLKRQEEELDPAAALLIVEGIVVGPDSRAARLISRGARDWITPLKQMDGLHVPASQVDDLLEKLLSLPNLPRLALPVELEYKQIERTPVPQLLVRKENSPYYSYKSQSMRLAANLRFNYEGVSVDLFEKRSGVYDRASRSFMLRDFSAERLASDLLVSLGFKQNSDFNDPPVFELSPKNLPRTVKSLLEAGWKVEAEGKLYRRPSSMSLSVSSGIDWFELHGAIEFGEGMIVKLPDLLSALKRGESMVQLGDGSFGLLPEDWLKKYGPITSFGETAEDHLRFRRTQTGILDALLAAQPDIKTDETSARILNEWRNFKGIEALSPPASFVGSLRPYQSEALGWFQFLERFSFGGCLADDMGLGKTVQVLALLESVRVARQELSTSPAGTTIANATGFRPRPSLVVVPRSLVFNWQQEASRFTPQLRVLTHTGAERTKGTAHFDEYDLILTTYGTLRRDALYFHNTRFDYVILDESQAIKNAKTESAKAVRLLNSRNRLALSGTPIENHLGELWSLFEFLNPGMLGDASVFQLSINGKSPDEGTRSLLARALRPFILRRTKEQVAKELPEKLEQTIYCEMETQQGKQYDELRDHYRRSLLERVERTGINRAKIQILEALLRLRQAACHPALLDEELEDVPSAKLDVLLPQLSEVIAEGHKALVFSQFTSFLAIVRRRLEREGIIYEYLDGQTRDRGARVDRFQGDLGCQLFLISLKAGGLGLNLTAADYVFLLDPWWNPAVESQAIDRAHRIGQSKRVFAYRLITRDTVEEKVLALQATKRELADAIINEDNSLIRNITSDDLLLLLS
ncbi:MAG TPA: DEAD/DEAH box helicase [Pyrinomonadaceae bacterium]|jgi:superfamily II DNA or RNA helicase